MDGFVPVMLTWADGSVKVTSRQCLRPVVVSVLTRHRRADRGVGAVDAYCRVARGSVCGVRRDEPRLQPEATTPGHAVAALGDARHERVLWGGEAVSVDRVLERAMHAVVLVQDGAEANEVLRCNGGEGEEPC